MSSILRLWEKKGYPPALAHYGTVELDSLWLDYPFVFLLVSCASSSDPTLILIPMVERRQLNK